MSDESFWLECQACRYRWPGCPCPASVGQLTRMSRGLLCPGCGETEKISMLPNIDADGNPLRYEAGVAEPKAEAAE